jgi:hypothetical protein
MSQLDTSDVNAPEPITAPEAPAETQTPAVTAPSAEETKTPESDPILEALKSDDDGPEVTPAEKAEEPKTTEKAPEAPKEQEEETTTESAEDARKGENARIRQLVAEKNALKAQLAEVNADAYQVSTKEELVEEGMSPGEAQAEALRQELIMRDYNEQVADAQFTIAQEAQDVVKDFPMFDETSDSYNEEVALEAAQLLQDNLIFDENTGQLIGSNVSPYKLYKTLATAASISSTKGKIEGQKSTETMLANADTPSSAAPPATKKDEILDILSSDD